MYDMHNVSLGRGDRVFWHDPDNEKCSTFGTVVSLGEDGGEDDSFVLIWSDFCSYIEACPWECEKVNGNGNGNGRRNKAKH